MKKRIGIPKALLFYKYGTKWVEFFKELGAEVLLSSDSTKRSFEAGCAYCLDDICLPIKTYFGHVAQLKDKVDFLFIPRVVSVEARRKGKSFTCPKIIGLPDMLLSTMDDLPDLLSPTVDVHKRNEFLSFLSAGSKLTKNPLKILSAYKKAVRKQNELSGRESAVRRGIKIGLISHSYNLCGAYPTPDVKRILEKLGTHPVVIESFDPDEIRDNAGRDFPELSWNFEREMLGGAIKMINEKDVSGCIVLSNFSCGPDSLTGDYILRMARRRSEIPFTMLTIDEHTGEAGIKTRLEAFVDMIKMRAK